MKVLSKSLFFCVMAGFLLVSCGGGGGGGAAAPVGPVPTAPTPGMPTKGINWEAAEQYVDATGEAQGPVCDADIDFTYQPIDPDGSIVSHEWNFGDGSTTSSESEPVHQFVCDEIGGGSQTYTVSLTVTDNDGAVDSHEEELEVFQRGEIDVEID